MSISDEAYRSEARQQTNGAGEFSIARNAEVRRANDNSGAWVATWLFIEASDADAQRREQEHLRASVGVGRE